MPLSISINCCARTLDREIKKGVENGEIHVFPATHETRTILLIYAYTTANRPRNKRGEKIKR